MNTKFDQPWLQFVGAKTSSEFGRAWLELISSRCTGITASVVLIHDKQQHAFLPLAAWPEANQEFVRFSAIVQKVLNDQQGHIEPLPEQAHVQRLAYPLLQADALVGVVALEYQSDVVSSASLFREVHWGSAWLLQILAEKSISDALLTKRQLLSVLENLATSLRHEQLQQALFEVSNGLRKQFDCSRVAIGLVKGNHVRVKAISDSVTFEKSASLVKSYVAFMAQALDALAPVYGDEQLQEHSGAPHVLAYPLIQSGQCVGVFVFERERSAFTEDDMPWLEAFSGVFASALEQRRMAEQGLFARALADLRWLGQRVFGPSHYVWKLGFAASFVLICVLFFVPFQYRVSAPAVIEGEVQRVVASPFDGFVSASLARAGDVVKQGQVLAQLDDRELLLEQAQWRSTREQHSNKLRAALAEGSLPDVQVMSAQLQEAEAQLQLVTQKIQRANLKAPFDGIVISGDLSQQVGGPVELGKTLFEVAPLQTYRIVLKVDEREMRHIRLEQQGRLLMTGLSDTPMNFVVSKITPLAESEEGRNFFRVEATVANPPAALRPGMEGVGKVEVADRSLWWIATRSLNEWLLVSLWKWIP
ncbi:MAG TPA: HlyD family efflux transporter periplasmic adaptor subunit [Limnobacter sp.]|nr:HlyD family efflux transporter periplasmic adaptor subunit [Limnobacter sp.]